MAMIVFLINLDVISIESRVKVTFIKSLCFLSAPSGNSEINSSMLFTFVSTEQMQTINEREIF